MTYFKTQELIIQKSLFTLSLSIHPSFSEVMNFLDKKSTDVAEFLSQKLCKESIEKLRKVIFQVKLTGNKLLTLNDGQKSFLVQKLLQSEKKHVIHKINTIQRMYHHQTQNPHIPPNPKENLYFKPKNTLPTHTPDFHVMRLSTYGEKTVCQKYFGEDTANRLYPNRLIKAQKKDDKRKTFDDRTKLHKRPKRKVMKTVNVRKFSCKQKCWVTQKHVREMMM